MAVVVHLAVDSPLRAPARYDRQEDLPRGLVELLVHHSPRLGAPHISGTSCRKPTWRDTFGGVDNLPDIANNDCRICPVARCRLRPHCKELLLIINIMINNNNNNFCLLFNVKKVGDMVMKYQQ